MIGTPPKPLQPLTLWDCGGGISEVDGRLDRIKAFTGGSSS